MVHCYWWMVLWPMHFVSCPCPLVKQQYHYLHWWRNNTTCIVIACSPYLYHAHRRQFGSSAAVSSSPPIPPWSGTWAAWCACQEPTHQVLGEILLRGSWTAQGPSVPGTLGGTGISVGYYGEPGVLRDHGGSGSLFPLLTLVYQCGVASTQCGGIGSPGAGVPLYQVTLLAFFPLVVPRLPLVAW